MLRYVTGRYVLPLSYRVTYWSSAVGLVFFAIYMARELATWSPATGDDRSALVIAVLTPLPLAIVLGARASRSYTFTPQAITRESPVPLWRRRLIAEQVHEGWLHLNGGAVLELVASDETRMRIPLEARLRSDFARLYPEVGHDLQLSAPVASSRFRVIIWVVVAVLVVSIIALAIALTRAGLTSWR